MLALLWIAVLALAPGPTLTIAGPAPSAPQSGTVVLHARIEHPGTTPLRLHFSQYVTSVDVAVTLRDGRVAHLHSGTLVPYRDRAIPSTDPMVPLPADLADPTVLDMRVTAEDARFAAPALETNYPQNPGAQPAAFYILTIGLLLGIALYHLMLFASLRDRTIAAYVIYLVAFILYETIASGLAWQMLWPFASIPEVAALRVAAAIVAASVFFFAQRFMRIPTHAPVLNRAFAGVIGAIWLVTIVGLTVPSTAALTSLVADAALIAAIGLCTACAIVCLRAGERPALFFLIGFAGLFVGAIAKIVTDDIGNIQSGAHFYGIEVGVCIDAVVLALGLADRIRREQALRERAEVLAAEAERLARTDALTGVSNRRLFDERLLIEWNRAVRHGTPVGIVMIDVDRFKSYNDMRGHLAGDDCLKLLARTCRSSAQRADEIFARYGGEEFVAILPGATLREAMKIAQHMIEGVRDLDIAHPDGGVITISAGAAAYEGGPFADVDVLLADADAALYAAKADGGDRVRSHAFAQQEGYSA